jgi:hypothetical protein
MTLAWLHVNYYPRSQALYHRPGRLSIEDWGKKQTKAAAQAEVRYQKRDYDYMK